MQIELLGPVRARRDDGSEVVVAGTRLRRLLAELALRGGRPVPTGLLEDALWGEDGATGPGALQSLVSRLRRTLGPEVEVTAGPAGYALSGVDVDVPLVEAGFADGRRLLREGSWAAAAQVLDAALARWRGEPVEIAGSPDAVRLEDARLDALADRCEARWRAGDLDGLPADLEELVAAHPLRERFAELRVRVLVAAGRTGEALAAYEQTRRVLAEELGADPSPALREAHLAALAEPATGPAPHRTVRSLTSFVGRDGDLERLTGLLATTQCVTVVGPGGAGKTRLATEVARHLARTWAVHEVSLAPVAEGEDVQGAVVSAVGVGDVALETRAIPRDVAEPLHRLRSALSSGATGRPVLLVLDNCEHVLDDTAVLVEDLLRHCPGLSVLCTSREALGAEGEALHPLGPLPTDAAVRLFTDRAVAVDPGFVVDDANRGVVTDLVRRLDGLPLALELAAARLRTTTLTDLDARLSDRFRVLAGGRRTAVARHRTLRAVVDWSWDLLEEDERVLLQRLSVFAGPVAVDAAAAVARDLGDEHEVADLLASLTEKSLLQLRPGPTVRYALLETIREYGAERLAASGDLEDVLEAHTAWALDLVARAGRGLRSRDQVAWSQRLDAEVDDLLAVLRQLVAAGRGEDAVRLTLPVVLWAGALGRQNQAREWVRLAASVPAPAAPVEALVVETADRMMGVVEAASSPGEVMAVLAVLRDKVDVLLTADANVFTRLVALVVDRFGGWDGDPFRDLSATAEQDAALAALTAELSAAGEPWLVATCELLRASAAENFGDATTMLEAAQRAEAGFRAVGDHWGLSATLRMLAQAQVHGGDLDAAEALYVESLDLAAAFGGADDEVLVRTRLAEVHQRQGRSAEAAAELARTRALTAGSSDPTRTWLVLSEVVTAVREGRVEDARRLASEHEAVLSQRPLGGAFGHERAALSAAISRVHTAAGELAQARARLVVALEAALQTRDMPIIALVTTSAAHWALADANPLRAARWLGIAAALRGFDDATDPSVLEVLAGARDATDEASVASAVAGGRALDRSAALRELAAGFGVLGQ